MYYAMRDPELAMIAIILGGIVYLMAGTYVGWKRRRS